MKYDTEFLMVISALLIIFAAILFYFVGYANGQEDALYGKWKYKLENVQTVIKISK